VKVYKKYKMTEDPARAGASPPSEQESKARRFFSKFICRGCLAITLSPGVISEEDGRFYPNRKVTRRRSTLDGLDDSLIVGMRSVDVDVKKRKSTILDQI